jgi:hypothetical protein
MTRCWNNDQTPGYAASYLPPMRTVSAAAELAQRCRAEAASLGLTIKRDDVARAADLVARIERAINAAHAAQEPTC